MNSIDPAWAWDAFEPSAGAPWNAARASHLFRRAAFGGTWKQIEQAVSAGPRRALDQLIAEDGEQTEQDNAAFYSAAEAQVSALISTGNLENLPAWWLSLMIRTPDPVLERVSLLWHGHFATSAGKVDDAPLMLDQNRLIRRHALGKFEPLVLGMARDPAMLLWLDSATNKKAHPNENFAREVMELFCLGLGAYTEADIKEAARAFTGWEVRHKRFLFNEYQHDDSEKTLLGQRGNWSGEDVIRILLEQPAAARFLVGKFYRAFISETDEPGEELIEHLAAGYREHDYDARWLMRRMLASNLFFSDQAMGQRVKSPVEMAIGLLRSIDFNANAYALADELHQQGQAVFYPPNVKGWDGGREWINSSALLSRVNLVWGLVGGDGRFGTPPDLEQHARQLGFTKPAEQTKWLTDLLVATPLPADVQTQLSVLAADDSQNDKRLSRVIQAIASRPEFHVS